MAHFSRILVPVDGSEQSMAAADRAIELAKQDKSELVLVHVIQLPAFGHYTPSAFGDIIGKGKSEAEKWLGRIKSEAEDSGIKVKTRVVESMSSPATPIVDLAKKEGADLIVMGTRGKTKIKKLLLGSVASGVITYAPCTVMVVR